MNQQRKKVIWQRFIDKDATNRRLMIVSIGVIGCVTVATVGVLCHCIDSMQKTFRDIHQVGKYYTKPAKAQTDIPDPLTINTVFKDTAQKTSLQTKSERPFFEQLNYYLADEKLSKAEQLFKEGSFALDHGNCKQAIESFNASLKAFKEPGQATIDVSPNAANVEKSWVFSHLGFCYCKLGKFQTAIDELTEAIKLDPQVTDYRNRAEAFRRLGKMQEYKEDLAVAAKLETDNH